MIRLMAIAGTLVFYISVVFGFLLENKPWKSLHGLWLFFLLTALATMFTSLLLKIAIYM